MSVAIGYNQCKALRPFACVRTGDSVPSQSVATGVVKVHRRILITITVLLQAGVIAALAVSNLPRIKQIPRLWEIPPYSAQFVLTPGIDDFGPLFGDLLE